MLIMLVGDIRAAEDRDFDALRTHLASNEGWHLEYDKKSQITVWTRLKVKMSDIYFSRAGIITHQIETILVVMSFWLVPHFVQR